MSALLESGKAFAWGKAMQLIDGGKHDAIPDKQYLVCEGGYTRGEAPTFQQAVTMAKRMRWFSPEGAFSIYEVRTGIHFEVPTNTVFDDLILMAYPNRPMNAASST